MRSFTMGLGVGVIVTAVAGAIAVAVIDIDGPDTKSAAVVEVDTARSTEVLARLDRVDDALASLGGRLDAVAREREQRGPAGAAQAAPSAISPDLAPVLTQIGERLAALDSACSRIPEIADRVVATEKRLDEAAKAAAALPAGTGSPFAEIETSVLLSRAKVLSKDPEQALAAVQAYQELLTRNLTDTQRRQALESVASLYFTAEDYHAAARSYAGAMELMDPRARDSLTRGISLGHSLSRSGDLRGAIDVFRGLIAHPHRTNISEANARSTIASCWRQLGETERARQELQTLIDRFGSETGSLMQQYLASARRRLTLL